ncbi:Alpha/Beta hydrolase protein [Cyathus striatus]|nr:Alpha/Beta hydrolase protein [Cyathus striatus]
MAPMTYPKLPPPSWPVTVPLRKLLPVYPPPEPLSYPKLPTPSREGDFGAHYSRSTHVFPASHLRTTRMVPLPPPPPENAKIRGSIVTDGYPLVLWNCVNRYVKKGVKAENGKNGLTLFFAHANGFPKEIWEPTLQYLLSSPAAEIIDEVWVWESVQHGDAALINAENLGGIFDWTDNTRDILNFLYHFIPPQATDAPLPVHLPRLSLEESKYRYDNGLRDRTFIAVGHSYGGCTSLLAAIQHPELFSAVIAVDPVVIKPWGTSKQRCRDAHTDNLTLGALLRRDTWASKEEALEIFLKSPFFRAWDPAVLRVYVECGLYHTTDKDGNTVVKLKMPGIQEAVVFSEVHTEYEVYQQMPSLDKRVTLRWVMPGRKGNYEFGPEGSAHERVWVRAENASNIRIASAGHLIAQEAPKELADDMADFLLLHYTTGNVRANL